MWSQKSTRSTSFDFLLKVVLWTNRLVFTNLRPHYQNSFFFNFFFFLFSTLSSKMSRNMYKLGHKLRKGQHFTDKLCHVSTNLKPHYQNSLNFFLLLPFFSTLSSRMCRNMFKLRHKLRNSKKGVGPTFTWSNEA